MVNDVIRTDLDSAIDVLTKGAGRRDANNLALSDQIQFSSILRTIVDTPEQTLDVVAAATQTREADKVRPEAPERDRRPAPRTDRGRDRARDAERLERPEPKVEGLNGAGLKAVSAPQEPAGDTPSLDRQVSFRDTVHEIVEGPARAKRVGLETGRAPETTATLVAARTAETPAAASSQETAPQSQALLVHAAQSTASAALADRQFSRIGEDLHDAALHRFTQVGQRAGSQTAASSLKQEQEVDLSSRLGLSTPLAVKVDVESEQAKARAMPLQSLNGGAVMAELGGLESDTNPFAQSSGRNGENLGTDQRTPTHGALMNDRALLAANANDFGQVLLRAQSALVAAQQAAQAPAETKPLLPSEAIQLNGTAAPSGPSQLSQTAKANPTTAARQPERPQPPAEQIAVKIRQAVGEGLDKINIKLNPANLGRVEVRLDIKDGHINATVLAERKETLELLQKDARGLERALLDAGLRTDIQSLSFGLRGDGQRHVDVGRERRQGTFGRQGRMDGIDRDEGISPKSNNYGRNLRVNGGVDIRV